MERPLLVLVLAAVAVGVAAVLEARGRTERPTRPEWAVPDHLDRAEFHRPGAPWLIAVFSSPTCRACEEASQTAKAFVSDDVAVQSIDSVAQATLHHRYGIEAVPLVLVAGPDGTVHASFAGSPTPDELREALTRVRSED